MTNPFTLRLPDSVRDLVTSESERLSCREGQIVRAALARLKRKPLTVAEVKATRLKVGMAALDDSAKSAHADKVRATRSAKNKPV